MDKIMDENSAGRRSGWLMQYYFLRFAVSVVWVVLASTVGKASPVAAAILLVIYPAWDALANVIDARQSGGFGNNKTQLFNFFVSVLTTIGIALALGRGLNAAILVFAIWAILSGLLQLATAVRRWKSAGAQWTMILSGAQSALAGFFFAKMAMGPVALNAATVVPYAAFGAFYFFVSAVWLWVGAKRGGNSARQTA
jgi:uncharacterized membrane protein HdeD (DUF308 family)